MTLGQKIGWAIVILMILFNAGCLLYFHRLGRLDDVTRKSE